MIRRLALATIALAGCLALLAPATPASASAGPVWRLRVIGQPTDFSPGSTEDTYYIYATNIGDTPTTPTAITIADSLPAGLSANSMTFRVSNPGDSTLMSSSACSLLAARCKYPASSPPVRPGGTLAVFLQVTVAEGLSEPAVLNDSVAVSGGGAATATATAVNSLSSATAPFGVQSFKVSAENRDGTPFTQAGGHPYRLSTTVLLDTKLNPISGTQVRNPETEEYELEHTVLSEPTENAREAGVELPPGLIGNPRATRQCSLAEFLAFGVGSATEGGGASCPASSQVGTVSFAYGFQGSQPGEMQTVPLYNLAPLADKAASLGFITSIGIPFLIAAVPRDGSDYGLRIAQTDITEVGVTWVSVETWGVPADPSHDPQRGQICQTGFGCTGGGLASGEPERPFLRLPTSCASEPLPAEAFAESWEDREGRGIQSLPGTLPAADGCEAVGFAPSLQARPTTNQADSPSGLSVDVHLPSNEAVNDISTSDLKDTTIVLPEGVRLNPSASSGLQGCSESQVGYLPGTSHPLEFTPAHANCPDASKLGTVSVETQLLNHPLPGAVYLAQPHQNPFGSLLAVYLVVEDPISGVIIKQAGKITADPGNGRLSTTFEESPQTPFEDLKVHFFGGAEGALRTPSVCGVYRSTSVLTPWSAPESGPPAEPSDQFQIGGNCASSEASEPNSPSFAAGTESPQAGQFSPFAFKLTRQDGSQELSRIETVLPPGLSGKLAGVGECPEAAIAQAKSREHDGGGTEELASPSCPASSEVGSVDVGAGAGPDPYYTSGHAYLAGPYAGAPISLVTIVPAVAGPFDLGDVVTRVALHVDPFTAQINAVSDPLPHIIDGIPLDIRSITLKLRRPQFTLNPTSCNPMSIGGSATSVFSLSAPLSERFQVGGCNALPFKPKLAIVLKGATKRSGFPALRATLTMKPGEANVAAAQVTLPHSSFLANAHIDKTCGHPELLSHSCPARSIYGRAKAWSPLLAAPLEGNVYLVTGFPYELPALVADLNGQIEVDLVGKVDTGREDGIRNTFEMVPDAPVSKFVLEMAGGKKSLIENSEELCAKHTKRKALAEFTAQNGKVWDTEPVVQNGCNHHRKGHGKKRRH